MVSVRPGHQNVDELSTFRTRSPNLAAIFNKSPDEVHLTRELSVEVPTD